MILALFVSLATAAAPNASPDRHPCPWDLVTAVQTHINHVAVNDQRYPLTTQEEETEFSNLLATCLADSYTAEAFVDWREEKHGDKAPLPERSPLSENGDYLCMQSILVHPPEGWDKAMDRFLEASAQYEKGLFTEASDGFVKAGRAMLLPVGPQDEPGLQDIRRSAFANAAYAAHRAGSIDVKGLLVKLATDGEPLAADLRDAAERFPKDPGCGLGTRRTHASRFAQSLLGSGPGAVGQPTGRLGLYGRSPEIPGFKEADEQFKAANALLEAGRFGDAGDAYLAAAQSMKIEVDDDDERRFLATNRRLAYRMALDSWLHRNLDDWARKQLLAAAEKDPELAEELRKAAAAVPETPSGLFIDPL